MNDLYGFQIIYVYSYGDLILFSLNKDIDTRDILDHIG